MHEAPPGATTQEPHPLRRFAGLFRDFRWQLAQFLVLSIVAFLAAAPVPFVVKAVFDTAIAEGRTGLLLGLALLMLVLQVVNSAVHVASVYRLLRVTTEVVMRLRQAVFDKLYALSMRRYETTPMTDLHDRVVHETQRVDDMSLHGLSAAVPSSIFAVGILGVLIFINWVLFAVSVAFVPVMYAVNRVSREKLRGGAQALHHTLERFSNSAFSALRTMRQTRILGAERHARDRQDPVLRAAADASLHFGGFRRIHVGVNRGMLALWFVLILAVGGVGVIDGRVSLGELFSFYAGLALLRQPLEQLIASVPLIVAGREALSRVFELLDLDDRRPYQGTRPVEVTGRLEMGHVSFAYEPGEPVLTDVSLVIEPGQVVALMGPNGSGKSTIAQLLLGFYEPPVGRISVDGVDYGEVDIPHLRRQFGVLAQDPIMVPGTVRENITYGRPDVSEADLARAVELAAAGPLIAELDGGLDTPAFETGPLLSGGQLQRVALARALLGRPRVLILDEPSTHLDVAGVEGLLENLRSHEDAPAMLLITHEPVVAALADTIHHVENGRLIRAVESRFDPPRREPPSRDVSTA